MFPGAAWHCSASSFADDVRTMLNHIYPRLGVHSVLIESSPLPGSRERWTTVLQVTVRHGHLIEWRPEEFICRSDENGEARYSPKTLEGPLPQLVERLCAHAELWFQAERDRVANERKRT